MVGQLLESGWRVFAGKNLDWPELGELAVQFPDRLTVLPLDVGSDSAVAEATLAVESAVGHLDLLIANAAINRSAHLGSVRAELNFDDMLREYNVNALGALRMVKAFLPLLEAGQTKRLCFVSSEAGSVEASQRTGWFGYCMSKAALNMAVKNLHNDLAGQGFSFRLYHPGWLRTYMSGAKNTEAHMEPEEGAVFALKYFLEDSVGDGLALRDWEGKVWPW